MKYLNSFLISIQNPPLTFIRDTISYPNNCSHLLKFTKRSKILSYMKSAFLFAKLSLKIEKRAFSWLTFMRLRFKSDKKITSTSSIECCKSLGFWRRFYDVFALNNLKLPEKSIKGQIIKFSAVKGAFHARLYLLNCY